MPAVEVIAAYQPKFVTGGFTFVVRPMISPDHFERVRFLVDGKVRCVDLDKPYFLDGNAGKKLILFKPPRFGSPVKIAEHIINK